MSWCVIALSDLESILVPEAVLCGHWSDSMETISKGQAWCGRTGWLGAWAHDRRHGSGRGRCAPGEGHRSVWRDREVGQAMGRCGKRQECVGRSTSTRGVGCSQAMACAHSPANVGFSRADRACHSGKAACPDLVEHQAYCGKAASAQVVRVLRVEGGAPGRKVNDSMQSATDAGKVAPVEVVAVAKAREAERRAGG
jgi:hypothetical protein